MAMLCLESLVHERLDRDILPTVVIMVPFTDVSAAVRPMLRLMYGPTSSDLTRLVGQREHAF